MNLASTIEKAQIKMAWWVEVSTARPCCTYYFGPFESMKEAVLAKPGYIEDLLNEGALGIGVEIKRCKPKELTIFVEEEFSERAGEIHMDANELLSQYAAGKRDFSGVNLSGANLDGVNLCGVDLCGAKLLKTNLASATLCGAALSGVVLVEANLSRAKLCGAKLRGADLYRANLEQADLTGADLGGATMPNGLIHV